MLPDDLKSWRAQPSGLQLFDGEETAWIIGALLAIAILADRMGWFV